ncbi:unnamed protein product [Allacma fusca]|uniref:Uncharacterized protein n=1 Tax=Allacma fusca TaxID=39272 RepID=A0A8J2JFP2_9HEXA|nr:unnamed protein product [Allacma fusca]
MRAWYHTHNLKSIMKKRGRNRRRTQVGWNAMTTTEYILTVRVQMFTTRQTEKVQNPPCAVLLLSLEQPPYQ